MRCAPSRAPTSSPRSIRQPCGAGDRCGAAVGVGVVGHDDVGVPLGGEGHREVHRTGLLRVREGDRGEVGVGLLLLVHDGGRREARGLQHLQHRRTAHAVQGGVDDVEIPGTVPREVRGGVVVAVHDRLVEHLAGTRHARSSPPGPRGRCARRSRCRRAARSGSRRRGRPCSRCPGAGCGSPSPSPPRRSRARGSHRPAAAWATAVAAAAPGTRRPSSPRRCRSRTRRSCSGRRSRSPRGCRRESRCRGGTPPGRPPRGAPRRGSSGWGRGRGRRGDRRCRTPACRRTCPPGRRRRRRPRPPR